MLWLGQFSTASHATIIKKTSIVHITNQCWVGLTWVWARVMAMFLNWAVVMARPLARTMNQKLNYSVYKYCLTTSLFYACQLCFQLLHKSILSQQYFHMCISVLQHWPPSIFERYYQYLDTAMYCNMLPSNSK